MGVLQGKGIWTLYDDVATAVGVAPSLGAKYILCKVSKHGRYAPEAAMSALAKVGARPELVPVAWTYSYLDDIEEEANCLKQALIDGFEAIIIDAEADINMKAAEAALLVKKVQEMGIDTTNIYLCSDPRLDSKLKEIPTEQLSKICKGGFIPMIYGEILPANRDEAAQIVTKAAYDEYDKHKNTLGYGSLPLMPAIATYWDNQGHARMNYVELKQWFDEVEKYNPPFVSLYRAGVTTSNAWRAFQELEVEPPESRIVSNEEDSVVRSLLVVAPDGEGYSEGFFEGDASSWHSFRDDSGNTTKYRSSSTKQTMWAAYEPRLKEAGHYVIETFVPGQHATTAGAQFFIVHYENGQRKETNVKLDMRNSFNVWVALGVFELNPNDEDTGRVNRVDVTSDKQPKEIAFSAIRWRLLPAGGAGYDSPIGTDAERAGAQVWPGLWNDANPFLSKYSLGFHTGADLNLNKPTYNLDKGKPVYSIADGTVTYASEHTGDAWRACLVIEHDPLPDGTPVFSRYGHVDAIKVKPGDKVTRGQQVAQVGLSGGPGGNYHLHFDISTTTILKTQPLHWPGDNWALVNQHYVDPKEFILAHRPVVK